MDVEALIGWNLKRLRKARNLSQEEIGLRLGIADQAYISRVESGQQNPTAVMLYLMASALAVNVAELFQTDGVPNRILAGTVIIRSSRSQKK
ncbi:helix-turn-helix domain-containing protein [Asticcacaulis sp.]|jgi:transcriptional regulator with XRE-family HTH domain|uniref:helix-turn-helix domain-containing protein n=1 Tax=Asticcacaulis sp. TaxID=1872648 RepID=UPI003F7C8E60